MKVSISYPKKNWIWSVQMYQQTWFIFISYIYTKIVEIKELYYTQIKSENVKILLCFWKKYLMATNLFD